MPNTYECSLSGVRAEGEFNFDKDNMGDLPVGWVQVSIKRRSFNPQWVSIQQAKDTALKVMMASVPRNVPAEVRGLQENMIRMQLEAQYFAMEKETPVFVTAEEVIYIADPDSSSELKQAYNDARATLGMEPHSGDGEEGDAELSDSPQLDQDGRGTRSSQEEASGADDEGEDEDEDGDEDEDEEEDDDE